MKKELRKQLRRKNIHHLTARSHHTFSLAYFLIFFSLYFLFFSIVLIFILSAFPEKERVESLFKTIDRFDIPFVGRLVAQEPELTSTSSGYSSPFSSSSQNSMGVSGSIVSESIGASASPADQLLQPSDIVYLGAIRLPAFSGPNYATWDYSNGPLAYFPLGDPSGVNDGFPGSLFAGGHVYSTQVAELSIPGPVYSPTKNLNDLPTASFIQGFNNPLASVTNKVGYIFGMTYLPPQGQQTIGKIHYCVSLEYQDESSPAPPQGWFDTDLTIPAAGAWFLNGVSVWNSCRYIAEIPQAWSDAHTPGLRLAQGRHRNSAGNAEGPNLFATAPWQNGNPPAPGTTLSSASTLMMFGPVCCDPSLWAKDFSPSDTDGGLVWATSGSKSAVLVIGLKDIDTANAYYGYENWVTPPECEPFGTCQGQRGHRCGDCRLSFMFYDPEDIAAVVNGSLPSYSPQWYSRYEFNNSFHAYGPTFLATGAEAEFTATYDRERGYIFVSESYVDGADGAAPIVHVFKINTTSPTVPTVSVSAPAAGQTVGQNFSAQYSASGNLTGVSHVDLQLDSGAIIHDRDTNGPNAFTNIAVGSHTLRAFLVRSNEVAFANPEASAQVTFTVANIVTCTNVDGDGYNATTGGICGTVADCNDSNPTIYPGKAEICGDGIDQDCSGADLVCGSTGTLGNAVVGTSTDTSDSNSNNAIKFTMPNEDGTAVSISAYIASPISASPNNLYQVAIYSDSGGSPGALLTSSASQTINGDAWNTVNIPNVALTRNTVYWIAYNTNGLIINSNNLRYSTGSVGQWVWRSPFTFGTWSNPFGSITGISDTTASIYVTYNRGGGNSCTDGDEDGYGIGCSLGSDCSDGNPLVHVNITCMNYGLCVQQSLCVAACPSAPAENCTDAIDNNCNGQTDGEEASCLSPYSPPMISITFPSNSSTISSSMVTITYTQGGNLTGVNHTHLQLDFQEVIDLDNDGSYTFSGVADGVHTISIWMVLANHSRIGDSTSVTFIVAVPQPQQNTNQGGGGGGGGSPTTPATVKNQTPAKPGPANKTFDENSAENREEITTGPGITPKEVAANVKKNGWKMGTLIVILLALVFGVVWFVAWHHHHEVRKITEEFREQFQTP